MSMRNCVVRLFFPNGKAPLVQSPVRTIAYFGARDQRFRRNVITCFGGKLIAGFGGT